MDEQHHDTHRHQSLLPLSVLARAGVLVVLLLGIALLVSTQSPQATHQTAHPPRPQPEQLHPQTGPFQDLSLTAAAAFVFDVRTQTPLFSYNADAQLPLASITKLMTAYTAAQTVTAEETVVIPTESLRMRGDTGLYANERWRAKELLDFTLVTSSNDGADALASAAHAFTPNTQETATTTNTGSFVRIMNKHAQQLGLTDTYFLNETGLDANGFISGGYGSARDIGVLLAHIIQTQPELVEATAHSRLTFTSRSDLSHTATNTNRAVGDIPGLIASKTGFTDLAGGNLAVAFDVGVNRPIVAVVLGSTYKDRFTDMRKLVTTTLKTFE